MIKYIMSFSVILFLLTPVCVFAASEGSFFVTPLYIYDETKTWYIYEMKPGEIKEDAVMVTNNSNESILKFHIYAVDAIYNEDEGSFIPEEADSERDSIGKWIEVDEDILLVNPGETKIVNFTLSVPENTEHGLYIGAVMAEGIRDMRTQENVIVIPRVGARMFLTVTDNPNQLDRIKRDIEINYKGLTTKVILARIVIVVVIIIMICLTVSYFRSYNRKRNLK